MKLEESEEEDYYSDYGGRKVDMTGYPTKVEVEEMLKQLKETIDEENKEN